MKYSKPFENYKPEDFYDNANNYNNNNADNNNDYNANNNPYNNYNKPHIEDMDINMDARNNIKGKSSNDIDYSQGVVQMMLEPFRGTDAYSGFDTIRRVATFVYSSSASTSASAAMSSLHHDNKNYDYSKLNAELEKQGFAGITRDDNITSGQFLKHMQDALSGSNWTALTNPDNKSKFDHIEFSGFDHIEFSGTLKTDLKNGYINAVDQNGNKEQIRLKDIQIQTKNGALNGSDYMQKFIEAKSNRDTTIIRNSRNINEYIKNNNQLAQMGLQHMTSSEITRRLITNKEGASFRGHQLNPQQVRLIQDIAQYKHVAELNSLNKSTTKRFHTNVRNEARRLIKDSDVYQGYAVSKKGINVLRKVSGIAPNMVNARINRNRLKLEKLQSKGNMGRVLPGIKSNKLADIRQRKYDLLYGKNGALTKAQKPIGSTLKNNVKNKYANAKHSARAKMKNSMKTSMKNSKMGKALDRRTSKFKSRHPKLVKGGSKIRNAGMKIAKNFAPVRWVKKSFNLIIAPFDFIKRIFKGVVIAALAAILIPVLIATLIEVGIPLITMQLGGGLAAAAGQQTMELAAKKTTASTKEIYNYFKETNSNLSTADILGIMSLMKYKSDLNAFYIDAENNKYGLLAFDSDEADQIIQICTDNNWNDPFDMNLSVDEDADIPDDADEDEVINSISFDTDSLNNSRKAQIQYINSLLNDSNYPSNQTVSIESMANQAVNFAVNVRGINNNDIETLNAIKKSAVEMYYEYVMWDIEYLKVSDGSDGATLANAALLAYARQYSGEDMNMSTLFPDSSLSSIKEDWSSWFIKYALAQTSLVNDNGLYYISQNCNDIDTMLEKAEDKGFYHSYENVSNSKVSNSIKPGYIVVTQTEDPDDTDEDGEPIIKYKLGIVLNVLEDWDESLGYNSSTFTVIEGDTFGANYAYREDKEEIVHLGDYGSESNTKLGIKQYSIGSDAIYSDNKAYDIPVTISGFIAWYNPVSQDEFDAAKDIVDVEEDE